MSAERDSEGFIAADPDGNPEMIDIGRDAVGFRGEGDRHARQVHKLPMPQWKVVMLTALAVSMGQASRVIFTRRHVKIPSSIFRFLYLFRCFPFPSGRGRGRGRGSGRRFESAVAFIDVGGLAHS